MSCYQKNKSEASINISFRIPVSKYKDNIECLPHKVHFILKCHHSQVVVLCYIIRSDCSRLNQIKQYLQIHKVLILIILLAFINGFKLCRMLMEYFPQTKNTVLSDFVPLDTFAWLLIPTHSFIPQVVIPWAHRSGLTYIPWGTSTLYRTIENILHPLMPPPQSRRIRVEFLNVWCEE